MFYFSFFLIIFWFLLFVYFTEKINKEHPLEYEALGKPAIGFFSFKQLEANVNFLVFLFKRKHKALGKSYQIMGDVLLSIYVFLILGIPIISIIN